LKGRKYSGKKQENTMNEKLQPGYRIMEMDADERPRERLAKLGARVLSKAELLAILLRTGVKGENAVQVGQRLLRDFKGLTGLHRAPFNDLCAQRGLGEAKASQIKAALELGYRLGIESPDERAAISSPQEAADLLKYDLSALEQEHLRVILLNTRNQVLEIIEVYKGSVNSSQVHVGELFRHAIRRNATAIIIAHNHPSGDPTPSPDDVAVTRAIIQAGRLLDVDVLDHIIIGLGRWVSMKERGLAFAE
jgi:DNA repair protein RadC